MALIWPAGIRSAGMAAGIKDNRNLDVGLLVADEPAAWAGTFTKNAAAAASVAWSRSRLGARVRAIVVNSGNANACTGGQGVAAVEATALAAAAAIGCEADEILVASTGPIGVQLPVERIRSVLPGLHDGLSDDADAFSRSILTTDTRPKTSSVQLDGCTVAGVAKGAAMLAPNMATMLAFIVTDAALDNALLQECLSRAVARSFDRISVDACESTNDSVFLVSSGRGSSPDVTTFQVALERICRDLGEQMVRDAEGGSRLVRIQISGATHEDAAVELGRAVASSALWRAALHGADPNWGRVLAALGSIDRDLDVSSTSVSIGDVCVFAHGTPVGSLAAAAREMEASEVCIRCAVGPSDTFAEVLTTDLSPDYVTLNAAGTT